jgi:hypothetical protein
MNLTQKPVKRLFAFGCSFTRWLWTNWPEIVANHLNVPHWNFGQGGGGNQFMFTRLSQAKQAYNIGPDDLVIICWTNFSREDRWSEKIDDWELVGNIFNSNGVWDEKWIKKWSNSTHYAIRDLSIIHMARTCLETWGCQWHFISMCDLLTNIDEYNSHNIPKSKRDLLVKLYEKDIHSVLPNYYHVLWNNNMTQKFKKEQQEIHTMFGDGHPNPIEHWQYLSHIWPEIQSQNSHVLKVQSAYKKYLTQKYNDGRKLTGRPGTAFPQHILSLEEKQELLQLTMIRPSEEFKGEIL